ncbi:MAG: ISL3 family transposase, partial [bacterium]
GKMVRGFRDRRVHTVRDLDSGERHIYLEFEYRRVHCPKCQAVKQEQLSWLAESSRFTRRFEDKIGRQCREMSITQVADFSGLSWDQTRRIEMAYMRRLEAANPPAGTLRAIGIDEISIHKGQSYAVVVADMDQQRPIWLGGPGRGEEEIKPFFKAMGPERCTSIKLAVMDMWKPFRKATRECVPAVEIVYDKFHVLRHLADALDEVRRQEYKRVSDKERRFIKGQRYTLLSSKANLDIDGRRALRMLLKANKRLNKAYILKESFEQLWDYDTPGWSRRFFEHWQDQLKWSRLEPYRKFARMIEQHWDGIESYCRPENKVSLGFMEGLNNKIRVIQRRAYEIKDLEYLRLKVITSFLKEA